MITSFTTPSPGIWTAKELTNKGTASFADYQIAYDLTNNRLAEITYKEDLGDLTKFQYIFDYKKVRCITDYDNSVRETEKSEGTDIARAQDQQLMLYASFIVLFAPHLHTCVWSQTINRAHCLKPVPLEINRLTKIHLQGATANPIS